MTIKMQIEKADKTRHQMGIMKKAASTNFDADRKILKTVYR